MGDDLRRILNTMFFDGAITGNNCLSTEARPDAYNGRPSPITLLNSDYKLLTRIFARRLRPPIDFISNPRNTVG